MRFVAVFAGALQFVAFVMFSAFVSGLWRASEIDQDGQYGLQMVRVPETPPGTPVAACAPFTPVEAPVAGTAAADSHSDNPHSDISSDPILLPVSGDSVPPDAAMDQEIAHGEDAAPAAEAPKKKKKWSVIQAIKETEASVIALKQSRRALTRTIERKRKDLRILREARSIAMRSRRRRLRKKIAVSDEAA